MSWPKNMKLNLEECHSTDLLFGVHSCCLTFPGLCNITQSIYSSLRAMNALLLAD